MKHKITRKHEYTETSYDKSWIWFVENAHGGCHLHIRQHSAGETGLRHYGGIEYHSRTPFGHGPDDAPDHRECYFLKCPCWHDGSSIAAEDAVSVFDPERNQHEEMFGYAERFMLMQQDTTNDRT